MISFVIFSLGSCPDCSRWGSGPHSAALGHHGPGPNGAPLGPHGPGPSGFPWTGSRWGPPWAVMGRPLMAGLGPVMG